MVAITGMALSLPLHRLPPATRRAPAEQLALIGQPKPIRVPERRWRSWLDLSWAKLVHIVAGDVGECFGEVVG
jgi:hypothetical protein